MYDKIKKIQDGPYTEYFESRKNILPSINPNKDLEPIDYFNKSKLNFKRYT